MKIIFLVFITLTTSCLNSGEVNRWDCNKFDGAKIISGDGEFLGELGPKWRTDSIFNDSSSYASTWSQNSIFNTNSNYGNSYSDLSVFNERASNPPMIIADSGIIGYLSIGDSWNNERFNPNDIKYTCDWD